MPFSKEGIRIGTIVGAQNAASTIEQILPHGFECFEVTFGGALGGLDIKKSAQSIKAALGDSGVIISAVAVYGNPLEKGAKDLETLKLWETLIDHAHLFGTNLVCGFTGRIRGKPIDESIPRFKEVFGALVKRAAANGVRIAFENCDMGGNWQTGDWNIAHAPKAWELMFNAVPSDNIGLEWEPCHQMVKLIDPIPQLRKWAGKVLHIHGKDATICRDVVREHGIGGPLPFAYHRTPGFGDSNWNDIITILRQNDYKGTIDIEGWHDPVYRDELEMTGQVRGLRYLKECRGGTYVANPT